MVRGWPDVGKIGWSVGLLLLSLWLVPGAALGTQEVLIVDFGQGRDGLPRGWELTKKEGAVDLALVMDGRSPVLRLRSNSSSFAIQTEVDIDLKKTPYLVWQWKVTELPRQGDFRHRARDDQAAQLLVMFSEDVLRTEVIAYIWDSTAPKGTMGESTFPSVFPFLRIRAVVVESGDAEKGKWITETRNVLEDYKKFFGTAPDNVSGIRIQINTQHTNSLAESYWRFLTFRAQP